MEATRTDWKDIGARITEGDHAKWQTLFDSVQWQSPKSSLGFMQGYAIDEAIQEFSIPNVRSVGVSNACAPCGLLGIRAEYENGTADIFLYDEGLTCTPLAVRFTPSAEAA